ncbi:penicillin-binding transpeptidase domain-containing protein [Lentzea aerocolonigenes]|uniref:penicillin-binding transpeptidase domain-containing protein n=1 Tax=Lentzea aerocolonigenes TaxID=68170 RepID=UPI0004C333DD|nr:penicillin-binding transpeptidase domain-containing protein [Lentzea aerocolonigenes]MCP2250293.1 Penicillin binding protein transpeptidase domain-containing protein [Lentzea aerocolonigenes]
MKRLLPVLGALVLVGAVVAVVVWQRPEVSPPPVPQKDLVVQYADGSPLWNSKDGDPPPLVRQVLDELGQQASLPVDSLRQVGAVVVTTIDPKAQAAGRAVIEAVTPAQPGTLRYSVTAVDPATGGVLAYVPGDSRDDRTDYAGGVLREPGSAFFPINAVAALQNGVKLDRVFDGRAPRTFYGTTINDKAKCGERCTVRDALAKSSNVAMYDLVVNQVGIKPTVDTAHQAGVPDAVVLSGQQKKLLVGEEGGTPNGVVSLGGMPAAMRPLDLTTVYATFAAGGVHRRTHFVAKVTGESGDLLYRATESTASAFDADGARSKAMADEVTTVLKENTLCPGSVCRAAEYEMPDAVPGLNQHAWTVGYTDRMAVTVLVGTAGTAHPVKDATGAPIAGAGLPKTIWQRFVEKVQQ